MGAPAPEALTALGSDLTFSVSFALASELRDQAAVSHVSESQLIAVLLLLTVLLGRITTALAVLEDIIEFVYKWVRDMVQSKTLRQGDEPPPHVTPFVSTKKDVIEGKGGEHDRSAESGAEGGGQSGRKEGGNGSDNASTNGTGASDIVDGTYRHIRGFFHLFVDTARRITASLLVQIVARGITTDQPLSGSRVVSLMTITVFFVFLQSGAMITERTQKSHTA